MAYLRRVFAPWHLHHEIVQEIREGLLRDRILAIAYVHCVENKKSSEVGLCKNHTHVIGRNAPESKQPTA